MLGILSYRRPVNLIVAVNIMAFGLLYFYKQPYDWRSLIAALLVVTLICTAYLIIIKCRMGDEYLFLIVAMLASLGFIMIYRLDRGLGFRQVMWFAAGTALFLMTYIVYSRIKILDRLLYFYVAASIVLFLVTLVFGKNIRGSTNWIVIHGFSFQPSELVKILFIFFLACGYNHPDDLVPWSLRPYLTRWKIGNKAVLAAITFMNIGFLILQQEWGTAVLFFLIYFIMLYVYEDNIRLLLANAGIAVVGILAGYVFVYHIKVRVDTWINPWADIAGKGYQIAQSLFAIGNGGFFGTGIGLGRPDLIPEVNTDFIFSAICEEMGIFGGVAVVLLYFILSYRGFKIVMTVRDKFEKVLALGVTVMFGLQTFIIIGGVIKLIPLTGITLPFISYGGSSLTTSFIALGVLQAISGGAGSKERSEANERK